MSLLSNAHHDAPPPPTQTLEWPAIKALRSLGGSGTVAEMEVEVADALRLTDSQRTLIRSGRRTELSYRLAWCRSCLKKVGVLENPRVGTWRLTPLGKRVGQEELKGLTATYRRTPSLR